MGDKDEDIFNSFNLTADEAKTYKTVLDKFDNHFVISRNIILERAKFNSRRQEAGETAEAFISTPFISYQKRANSATSRMS